MARVRTIEGRKCRLSAEEQTPSGVSERPFRGPFVHIGAETEMYAYTACQLARVRLDWLQDGSGRKDCGTK